MKKYQVIIQEQAAYRMFINAENEEEAYKKAERRMLDGDWGESLDPYGGAVEIDRVDEA